MAMPIPIVILAGGDGARIGGGKPQKSLAGATLLHHAIAKAETYSPSVLVSVSAPDIALPGNVARLLDEEKIGGPIAGLAAALRFATTTGAGYVMIMPCDTPFLPDNLLQRLQDGIGASIAAMAQYDGRLHPSCSLWRADAAGLLPEYLATGRRSLIGFAEMAAYVAVEWQAEAEDPFFNINTASELVDAERIITRRTQSK